MSAIRWICSDRQTPGDAKAMVTELLVHGGAAARSRASACLIGLGAAASGRVADRIRHERGDRLAYCGMVLELGAEVLARCSLGGDSAIGRARRELTLAAVDSLEASRALAPAGADRTGAARALHKVLRTLEGRQEIASIGSGHAMLLAMRRAVHGAGGDAYGRRLRGDARRCPGDAAEWERAEV